MLNAMTAMEYQKNLFKQECIEQGRFDLALKLKEDLGLDRAVELSGFSREELENEKLNKKIK